MIKHEHFDSLDHLGRVARTRTSSFSSESYASWSGGTKWDTLMTQCTIGNDKLVPEAEKLIGSLDSAIEVPGRERYIGVAGGCPIIPMYLTGQPECMLTYRNVCDDTTPITIWVDISASAAIKHEDMTKRGTAILALVMKLQATRSVNLKICSLLGKVYDRGDSMVTIDLQTRPISLAEACYALTDAAFFRRVVHHIHTNGGMPIADQPTMRQWLGATGHVIPATDILIPAILWTFNDDILANPVEWVKRELARALGAENGGN